MDHPGRLTQPTRTWTRRHDIDWQDHHVVVIESDDWGACEVSRDEEDAEVLGDLFQQRYGTRGPVDQTLESPQDLERLYSLLEQFQGADGNSPVFTAFITTGNPDFQRIRDNDFGDYLDIGIDEGFPATWQRGDVAGKWLEGIDRGIFAAEYHANMHHTNPMLWLELLNQESSEGQLARHAFDRGCYYQGARRLPEYTNMNVRQQDSWIQTGIKRFSSVFGSRPAAAASTDAYPLTEVCWALNGIRTICLKNARTNRGEVIIAHTKPWNNQDPYVPMGAYCDQSDMIYLSRNVDLDADTPEQVVEAIRQRWDEGDPAVISTRRGSYVSLDSERVQRGFDRLETVLGMINSEDKVRYLTTQELSDIYRRGWSLRRIGDHYMLRQYTGQVQEMLLPGNIQKITAVPVGISLSLMRHGDRTVVSLPTGDFLVEGDAM